MKYPENYLIIIHPELFEQFRDNWKKNTVKDQTLMGCIANLVTNLQSLLM